MKHIKTFESKWNLPQNKRLIVQGSFNKSNFTPATDKVNLSQIYQYIIIETEGGNIITIDKLGVLDIWMNDDSGVTSAIRKALDNISDETYDDIYFEDFEDFKSYEYIVNLLDYNPINFQEIENILIDHGYSVDNIWGAIDNLPQK